MATIKHETGPEEIAKRVFTITAVGAVLFITLVLFLSTL
jgi:hypothetical protein